MQVGTDPIGDMLTRIRNAGGARHATVAMPNSRVKGEIARVLEEAGYIDGFELQEGPGAGVLQIRLRYHNGEHVISGIRRESKPGQRRYVKIDQLPKVLNGFGIAVLTTSRGVMTGQQAAKLRVGGEYLCSVW